MGSLSGRRVANTDCGSSHGTKAVLRLMKFSAAIAAGVGSSCTGTAGVAGDSSPAGSSPCIETGSGDDERILDGVAGFEEVSLNIVKDGGTGRRATPGSCMTGL